MAAPSADAARGVAGLDALAALVEAEVEAAVAVVPAGLFVPEVKWHEACHWQVPLIPSLAVLLASFCSP